MARLDVQSAGGANRLAFLDMIAASEIGTSLLQATDDGYNVLVGATPNNLLTFDSYAAHPHKLNAHLNSTAAGRYQIIYPTWAYVCSELYLRDFSPFNQDRAALCLIKGRGALSAIDAGDIQNAITLCSKEWASLPGAGYGQHEQKMSMLLAAYNVALPNYAGAVS